MFYVYILQSVVVGRYYIGVTENMKKRFYAHNNGLSKSTAPYRPFALRRVERFQTATEAYRRERFLKSKKSVKLLKLIIQSSPDVLAEQEVGIPISDRNVGTSGLSGRVPTSALPSRDPDSTAYAVDIGTPPIHIDEAPSSILGARTKTTYGTYPRF